MNFKKLMIIILVIAIGSYPAHAAAALSAPRDFQNREKGGIQKVALISVYDNYRVDPELKTAWGFGTVVKTPEESLLFDTGGDAEVLLFNMQKMNIDPQSIRKVIISHIHADHVGGLKGFLEINNDVTVFIPSSFPDSIRDMITDQGAEYVNVSGFQKISESVFSTGELYGPPREQSLLIDSGAGLIVMTGCGHPGIVNIIRKAKEMLRKPKVLLALGGFHHPPTSVVKAYGTGRGKGCPFSLHG